MERDRNGLVRSGEDAGEGGATAADRLVKGPTVPIEPSFRLAGLGDLESIVRLLADDPLGAQRERFESPLPVAYQRAFDAIDRDANNELVVAVAGETVIGVLQLTFIPNLTYRGSWRAQVEAVRVDPAVRGSGVGGSMLEWAIDRARQRGCALVQLTTDKSRLDAVAFYERLGFRASHEGMKLRL